MASTLLDELLSSLSALDDKSRAEVASMAMEETKGLRWIPNPGPQTDAYLSDADELFYGGAAGGGKTDLLIGIALNSHDKSLIVRREGPDLDAMEGRFKEILGGIDGWNGSERKWRLGGGQEIKLGSCKNEDDKFGYQGQAHDLKAFDEITQFTESQFRYISGWNRTTKQGQRCRVICTGNPPMTADGYWVKRYWGPWLDRTFPDPARPGELRWATTDEKTGETIWVDGDWSRVDSVTGETIRPRSRTFIPALLKDNPFLDESYLATLAGLPEPLRTQLIRGDFNVAERDQVNQVIPTSWVRAAQARWKANGHLGPMVSMGVDVAQGGEDKFVIAPRHLGDHIAALVSQPGASVPDGRVGAALVMTHMRGGPQVNVDMGGGYGKETLNNLADARVRCFQYEPAAKARRMAKASAGGKPLKLKNMRAELHWNMREILDPDSDRRVELPPDEEMVADLCAATWKLTPQGIQIEEKDHIRDRIGRSPDKGEAVMIAFLSPKDDIEHEAIQRHDAPRDVPEWDPLWS